MTRKQLILLITSIPVVTLWGLFDERESSLVWFWSLINVDLTQKYDWFVFASNRQYIRWYVHYSAYYYTLIVLAYLVNSLASSKRAKLITTVFLYFSIFRLVEYWLFRFHIGFTAMTLGIVLFSLFIIEKSKWRKYS